MLQWIHYSCYNGFTILRHIYFTGPRVKFENNLAKIIKFFSFHKRNGVIVSAVLASACQHLHRDADRYALLFWT